MTYFVLIVAILLTLLFIYMELKGQSLYAFLLKAFASFGFIIVFASAYTQSLSDDQHGFVNLLMYIIPYHISILILLGLVSGLLGDLTLALRPLQDPKRDKEIIIGGIICFSIGHVFYIFALMLFTPLSIYALLIGLVMTIVIFIGSRVLHFEMGIAKIPTLFYTFLIFVMVGQAGIVAIDFDFHLTTLFIFLGAILFSISDLVLAPIYYQGVKHKGLIALNLLTYYAAQLLIAFSVLFLF